jgi:predicted acylesterase/phospholipase RssA
VPALILAEIERRTGRPISESFDLIVGTSTGSILALGLTRPSDADSHKPAFSANDLVKLYRDQAGRIFPSSLGALRYLKRIFRPKFDPSDVEALYRSYFEDVRLQETLTNVAVPAYDIETNNRVWFTSWGGQGRFYMRDIVRGATAAPTFFPPARVAYRAPDKTIEYLSLVDGALFANNPAQDAMAFGEVMRDTKLPMLLVSIGTGRSARKYTFNEAWGWGVLGWMDPLLDIAFSDPAIDSIVKRKLEGHGDYYRVQVDLGTPPIELDDSSPAAIGRLEAQTGKFMKLHHDAIDGIVAQLKLPRASDCGPTIGADYERPDGPRERDAEPTR